MNWNHLLKKILLGSLVLATIIGVGCNTVNAAQVPANGAYITWSTNTYVPPFFEGKRLPTSGSPVTAWVVVFDNGKAIDLSQATIYWYADSNLLQSGTGNQRVSFNAQDETENLTSLQVKVQDATGNLWNANIQVPVISPKATIAANYPGGIFNTSPAVVTAVPYFFNTTDLSSLVYAWSVNGTTAQSGENPQEADINVGGDAPSGTNLSIQVTVTNPSDNTSANASTNLIYQKL